MDQDPQSKGERVLHASAQGASESEHREDLYSNPSQADVKVERDSLIASRDHARAIGFALEELIECIHELDDPYVDGWGGPHNERCVEQVMKRLRAVYYRLEAIKSSATQIDVPKSRDALETRLAQLEAERNEAIRLMSQYARDLGEMEGRYKAAHWPGIVDGWQERAEAAEAKSKRMEEALEAASDAMRMTALAMESPLGRITKKHVQHWTSLFHAESQHIREVLGLLPALHPQEDGK